MFKQFLTLVQNVLTLAKDLEQTRSDIKDVREQLLKLTLAMQRLSDEITITSQREQAEREKLALQLEVKYLERGRASKKLKRSNTKKGSKKS